MSHLENPDSPDFSFHWGEKGEFLEDKYVQFYKSFTYYDEEYFLYDSVYLYVTCQDIPFIGKILEIWEQQSHDRKVKILWFFRPNEIVNYLGDQVPLEREIFLASGNGLGLCNVNPLEAIAGKCRVICTSKDQRNQQPSTQELENAEFIFFRTFDVVNFTISDVMPDKISGVNGKLKYLLNQKKDQEAFLTKSKTSTSVAEDRPQKKLRLTDKSTDPSINLLTNKTVTGLKELRIECGEESDVALKKLELGKWAKYDELQLKKDPNPVRKDTVIDHTSDASRSQFLDRRKWFQHSWEAQLEAANQGGRLVLLGNLDPSITSQEIEDIMYKVFQQQCRVKVIQQATFQIHNYGQAYVIFKAKDRAEQAVKAINGGCLMLSQERPLVSSIGMLKIPAKASTLVGHLPTYRERFRVQREEMKCAVSTSHGSQPNTMEYDLALEWFLLQDKYLLTQKLLHESQLKERIYFRNHLKSK
ncbi:unnamed protein product [Musa acuminata subsp. burmannicoides]